MKQGGLQVPSSETSRKGVLIEGTGPKKVPDKPEVNSRKPPRIEDLLPKKKA